MPGTILNASGISVIPKRRMSSALTTDAAAAAWFSGVSFLKREFTETTSTLTSCSMLISASRAEREFVCADAIENPADKHKTTQVRKKSAAQQSHLF
jgi:hypothetical protein